MSSLAFRGQILLRGVEREREREENVKLYSDDIINHARSTFEAVFV